jgi:hypothetical protein
MSVASTKVISVSTTSTISVPALPRPAAPLSRVLMYSPMTPPTGKWPAALPERLASSDDSATRHSTRPDTRTVKESGCTRAKSVPPHRPRQATMSQAAQPKAPSSSPATHSPVGPHRLPPP